MIENVFLLLLLLLLPRVVLLPRLVLLLAPHAPPAPLLLSPQPPIPAVPTPRVRRKSLDAESDDDGDRGERLRQRRWWTEQGVALVRVEEEEEPPAGSPRWCRQRTDVDVRKHTAVRVLVISATSTSVQQSLLATRSSHFAMGQPGFRGVERARAGRE